ncbi:rRNA maturation RNase YbeY [Candidatus Methylopumilus universalis]|uniref:Endoribonuclease YbeY n=1 Tax=Candidatus Methylopumilus universalis TaxID=2588536 RepID=A0AAX1F080_9PROT|nr:rRNA maturation RNase YbeY [Candidatus Methylopumilus universalis]QDC41408.1 rRNA maturation RNase YbeY [Candidatus Methylopumilus universalis]QDC42690.1 rRNA maturation RNase YbeY [Candidatus Methylopumilus universalis]QDC55077.1 rRNA maturation RNase YbeY [Candidatus Methylopumilus universalis]QDC56358.1 rRNA maturation RNase YbeY [Candidatus Methylopumilus universalis]QDC57647.1 rRNA maturation RNase YbeY [Candidatus Methylopumilus universalis]
MESKPIIVIQDMVHKNPILKKTQCLKWLSPIVDKNSEITIRIVDNDESINLNNIYRKKKYPTNVLSFLVDDEVHLIGDIVLCAPVIEKEALEQSKKLEAHYAHLIIHGALHLYGYDHENKKDADIMEAKEIKILTKLGYKNPYLIEESKSQ